MRPKLLKKALPSFTTRYRDSPTNQTGEPSSSASTKNADYEIVGVFDLQQLQKNIAEQCAEMSPELRPAFAVATRNEKTLVGARIEGIAPSMRPAYRRTAGISKGSFVRVGDRDAHMTQSELYAIFT